MKVAVIGSRTFENYTKLEGVLDQYDISEIISGGARGADSLGELYALNKSIPVKIFKADWSKYGKAAGFIRNKDIIDNCDMVIAFWDGKSKGTQHSINLANKQDKTVIVVMI